MRGLDVMSPHGRYPCGRTLNVWAADDRGYWEQVEAYVSKHTEAQFSHGSCPQCLEQFCPEEWPTATVPFQFANDLVMSVALRNDCERQARGDRRHRPSTIEGIWYYARATILKTYPDRCAASCFGITARVATCRHYNKPSLTLPSSHTVSVRFLPSVLRVALPALDARHESVPISLERLLHQPIQIVSRFGITRNNHLEALALGD